MEKNMNLSKQNVGFPKAYNPHLRRNKNIKKTQEEEKKVIQEELLEQKEKSIPILISKEYLARQLLENGYIDSYIDFFYLGWKKTPNIKKNYSEKNQEEEEEEQKDEENMEENQIQEDQVIPRHDFNLNNLENFYYTLKEAEDNLRKSELEGDHNHDIEAIDKYNSIRNDTLHQGIPLESIYFNKKCIDIAKKNGHIESLIKSLIYMGDCFDKTNLPSDMNISKKLKEEAKDIFKDKLEGKNYTLEMNIYKALKDLYSELANQQEQSKNYKKAIELLNKLLEVLDTAKGILSKISEKNKKGFNEKEIEDLKTEAYLKIANIYFIMKDYDNTIATLDNVPNIKSEDYSSLTVS